MNSIDMIQCHNCEKLVPDFELTAGRCEWCWQKHKHAFPLPRDQELDEAREVIEAQKGLIEHWIAQVAAKDEETAKLSESISSQVDQIRALEGQVKSAESRHQMSVDHTRTLFSIREDANLSEELSKVFMELQRLRKQVGIVG